MAIRQTALPRRDPIQKTPTDLPVSESRFRWRRPLLHQHRNGWRICHPTASILLCSAIAIMAICQPCRWRIHHVKWPLKPC